MYMTRFPAIGRKGISLRNCVGNKGGYLDGVVEPQDSGGPQLQPSDGAADALLRRLPQPRTDEPWRRHRAGACLGRMSPSASPTASPGDHQCRVRHRFLLFAGGSLMLIVLTLIAALELIRR
jgi:hypothetical protein